VAIKVLAVDDEPNVLRLIKIKLSKAGFEVLTASDGEAGLNQALTGNPDVVLLDVMMPKMDGYSVLEAIKTQMDPAPLVLMLTAEGQESDIVRGLTTGADDYIVKPFAPRELVSRVNVALIKAGKSPNMGDD
jgi:two-component system alkaline phosphatase synthesis response regulator PhoP